MQTSKKSSKNKPKVVFIYGAPAVGKLTIGKELEKQTGFKLTHNHLINDLVRSVFERGTLEANLLIEKLRYQFYEDCVKMGADIIITHCYAHDYVSPTGLTDPLYVKNLKKNLNKLGAEIFFVHLYASDEALLNRVSLEDRKEYKKLVDKKIMKELLKKEDWVTSPNVKNNLKVDNTKLSAKKVAQMIKQHFNL